MSWQATSWALREAPCPNASARLVLIALADRCQPDGRSAWPTIETLMAEAHCSRATVKRALHDMEELGVIRRGDQSLSCHDEHGGWLAPQWRPIVWECCMNVALEKVSEKPGKQATEERENRRLKMSPQTCEQSDSRGIKMSPQSSRGFTSEPSRGVTGEPLNKKTNNITNNPLPPKGGISLEKNNLDVSKVEEALSQALSLTYKPERKDHVAARSLIDTYGLDTVLAVIAWCTAPASTVPGSKRDGFWRGVLRGVAGLAKHWDVIVTQMREDPTGGKKLKSLHASEDTRLQISLKSATRYKIYGSSKLTTGQGWEHLDNETPSDECVACATDPRNKQFHGVGVRDKLSDTPAEHSDRAHLSCYHFIGHRTTTNIYATSKEDA